MSHVPLADRICSGPGWSGVWSLSTMTPSPAGEAVTPGHSVTGGKEPSLLLMGVVGRTMIVPTGVPSGTSAPRSSRSRRGVAATVADRAFTLATASDDALSADAARALASSAVALAATEAAEAFAASERTPAIWVST